MRTTNYEISKQLAEAGFVASPNWAWYKSNKVDITTEADDA